MACPFLVLVLDATSYKRGLRTVLCLTLSRSNSTWVRTFRSLSFRVSNSRPREIFSLSWPLPRDEYMVLRFNFWWWTIVTARDLYQRSCPISFRYQPLSPVYCQPKTVTVLSFYLSSFQVAGNVLIHSHYLHSSRELVLNHRDKSSTLSHCHYTAPGMSVVDVCNFFYPIAAPP